MSGSGPWQSLLRFQTFYQIIHPFSFFEHLTGALPLEIHQRIRRTCVLLELLAADEQISKYRCSAYEARTSTMKESRTE